MHNKKLCLQQKKNSCPHQLGIILCLFIKWCSHHVHSTFNKTVTRLRGMKRRYGDLLGEPQLKYTARSSGIVQTIPHGVKKGKQKGLKDNIREGNVWSFEIFFTDPKTGQVGIHVPHCRVNVGIFFFTKKILRVFLIVPTVLSWTLKVTVFTKMNGAFAHNASTETESEC